MSMTAPGTDAIGALGWGLRRYWLLVLACVLLGGAFGPAAARRFDAPAEAEALVIANRLDMDLVALPRYGEAVFNNGSVAQAVAANFPDVGDFSDIIPDLVSLEATQDSLVFRVTGRDDDPRIAADLANVATDAFIEALNTAGVGVGTFALQSPARPPAEPDEGLSTVVAVAAGVGAGLLLGLAAVSLVLIVRRPVTAAEDAEEATGVAALGVVSVPRTRRGETAPPEQFTGLLPVCRRLLSLSTPTVLMVSRPREKSAQQHVTAALALTLQGVRDVHVVGGGAPETDHQLDRPKGGRRPLTLVDGSEPSALLQPPTETLTVLVAAVGTSSATLRAAVAEHLGGSAEARLLLVKRGRRARRQSPAGPVAHDQVPAKEELPVG